LILCSMAWGLTLPKKPEKSEPKPGQCAEAMSATLSRETKFTEGNCKATCSGVLLPTSIAADYIKASAWGSDLYMICDSEINYNELQFKKLEDKHRKRVVKTAVQYSLYGIAVGSVFTIVSQRN